MDCNGRLRLLASEPSSWIWQDRLRSLLPDDPEGEEEQQEKEALSAGKMDPIWG